MDINLVKLKQYAQSCSLLYVEDDEVIRTQTQQFLGRFFPDIVIAEDGALGLEAYNNRAFDVVVTDINMPNMNGIEMIQAIKETNYDQIIIVTSAHNDSSYLMELINLNISHFVLKPFNNKQFLYVLYKTAEALNYERKQQELQSELSALSHQSQVIVDEIKVGIIIIRAGVIGMANKAFLEMCGFNDFETLVLEMPEIGVMFSPVDDGITATTNQELIEQLLALDDAAKKVRLVQGGITKEYQVILTKMDDESYILSFNDISAIHDALSLDDVTHLPMRKFFLERLEILKQETTTMHLIIVSAKNLANIEKWYGKASGMQLEAELATILEKFLEENGEVDDFLGYFGTNKFVILKSHACDRSIVQKLKTKQLSSLTLKDEHSYADNRFTMNILAEQHPLDHEKSVIDLEIDVINLFDTLK